MTPIIQLQVTYPRIAAGGCEAEAKRSKLEMERLEAETKKAKAEADDDGCIWGILSSKVFWIVVVCFIIMGMCSDPEEEGETEENNVENTETTSYIDTESHDWWQLC